MNHLYPLYPSDYPPPSRLIKLTLSQALTSLMTRGDMKMTATTGRNLGKLVSIMHSLLPDTLWLILRTVEIKLVQVAMK